MTIDAALCKNGAGVRVSTLQMVFSASESQD